jgi:TrmH family RNA methyltransferase
MRVIRLSSESYDATSAIAVPFPAYTANCVKLLTLARDLKRRKGRQRQGLFVAEGVRAVEELLRSPLRLRGALVTAALVESPRGAALRDALEAAAARAGADVATLDPEELASAADTETPQGVLAIAEVPGRSLDALDLSASARLIVLDGVQDPGNVGTIVRTAAALGAAATVAMPGTVDLWSAKVVRSAMGAHFHHSALAASWEELDLFLGRHGVALWGTDAAGTPLDRTPPPMRLALALGNEGSGLSAAARERATLSVALPLAAGVESLNVAVAAGIFLYQLRP